MRRARIRQGHGGHFSLLCSALLISWVLTALPSRAQAWTEAAVQAISVELEVDAERDRMQQTLHLHLRVDAGWMRALDLRGFAPALSKAQLRALSVHQIDLSHGGFPGEALKRIPARAEDTFDALSLRFERKHALRRGDYAVTLKLETGTGGLITPGEHARQLRFSYTLPAWEHALFDLRIDAHFRSKVLRAPGAQTFSRGGQSWRRWERIQLPRHSRWHIEAQLQTSAATFRHIAEGQHKTAQAAAPPNQAASLPWLRQLFATLLALLATMAAAGLRAQGEAQRQKLCLASQAWFPRLAPLKRALPWTFACLGLASCALPNWLRLVLGTLALAPWLSKACLSAAPAPASLKRLTARLLLGGAALTWLGVATLWWLGLLPGHIPGTSVTASAAWLGLCRVCLKLGDTALAERLELAARTHALIAARFPQSLHVHSTATHDPCGRIHCRRLRTQHAGLTLCIEVTPANPAPLVWLTLEADLRARHHFAKLRDVLGGAATRDRSNGGLRWSQSLDTQTLAALLELLPATETTRDTPRAAPPIALAQKSRTAA